MKIAVIGSRNIILGNISDYLPCGVSEIVSGGARGVDTCAREYANKNGLKLTEFLPEYKKYGKCAPLERNIKIVEYSDEVFIFWDGHSRGTKHVIRMCEKLHKKMHIYMIKS